MVLVVHFDAKHVENALPYSDRQDIDALLSDGRSGSGSE